MSFAINIDWQEEYKNNFDKWVNHGRDALISHCKHLSEDKQSNNLEYSNYCEECGISEDSAIPMMNYIYPLQLDNFSEEDILKVIDQTNCTVMENTETQEWFLSLCGGGMDLSQDIALAYFLLEKWIPFELCINVCTQKDLSIHGKNWQIMRNAVIESLKNNIGHATQKIKEFEDKK
jgi:hypothetical protein